MKPKSRKPIIFVDLLRTRVLYPLSISGVHLCKHLIQGEKLIFSLHTKCYVRFICRLMSPRPGEVMLKTPQTVKKRKQRASLSTTKQQTRCGPPRNQFVMICLLIVATILGSFSACFLNLIQ